MVEERHYPETGVFARHAGDMGAGLFADVDFEPGQVIFWMEQYDTPRTSMLPYDNLCNTCEDRGISFVPRYVYCTTPDVPMWYVNHSCEPNAGFANFGEIVGENGSGAIPLVAHRAIRRGEQITMDYALITAPYEINCDGTPYTMHCMCGSEQCRHTITQFHNAPYELQYRAMCEGSVIAHMLYAETHLTDELRRINPEGYQIFQSALESQLATLEKLERLRKPAAEQG
jgi:hypothetical protein